MLLEAVLFASVFLTSTLFQANGESSTIIAETTNDESITGSEVSLAGIQRLSTQITTVVAEEYITSGGETVTRDNMLKHFWIDTSTAKSADDATTTAESSVETAVFDSTTISGDQPTITDGRLGESQSRSMTNDVGSTVGFALATAVATGTANTEGAITSAYENEATSQLLMAAKNLGTLTTEEATGTTAIDGSPTDASATTVEATASDELASVAAIVSDGLPPSITRNPPRYLIFQEGDNVTLECKGTGVPAVTYEWRKNGIRINEALPNIHKRPDGSIAIQPATSMDEGFYQCFARNRYGIALSIMAHVQRAFLNATTGNTTTICSKTVQEETPFHMPCDAPASFPKPTYEWEMLNDTEDTIPIRITKRIQIAENGDLHFASALPEDDLGGQFYRCTTYNPYLRLPTKGSYTRLNVTRRKINLTYLTSTLPVDDQKGSSYMYKWTMTSNPVLTTERSSTQLGRQTTVAQTSTAPPTMPPQTTGIPNRMRGSTVPPLKRKRRRKDLSTQSHGGNGFFSETPIVAVIGGNVTLRCFFYVNWASEISWVGPRNTLPAGRHSLNEFNTSLTIDNVAAADEGYYYCSSLGNSHSLRMRVEAAPMLPTFNDGPYNVNVSEGESFTFRCRPVAIPTAKIVWLQDGRELDLQDPPARFAFSEDKRSLTIRDVCRDCDDRETGTDLMVIQCNASNVHGYAFAQGYLNVLIPVSPSIIKRPPESLVYRSGDNVTLDCKANGVPDVTYEWTKDGLRFNRTRPDIHRGEDGTITIRSATSVDEGSYQCIARNQFGTAMLRAKVQMAFLGTATRNITDVVTESVQEGQPFYISCDPPRSFPRPRYGWETANGTREDNFIPVRPSKRIQIAGNGSLHFAYALPEDDSGVRLYICTTYNDYLGEKARGGYVNVSVAKYTTRAVILGFPPSWTYLSWQSANRSATFRCIFNGYPEPTIVWKGPNDVLPVGRYTLSPFNTSLTITDIVDSDEGNYSCIGSNAQGNESHSHLLTVGAQPTFPSVTDGPHDVSVYVGESVTFNCSPSAKPAASIVWLQNGNELDPNSPPSRYEFGYNNRSLTIRNVCRSCSDRATDLTFIQCRASNVHGVAFAQGYLKVLDKYCVGELDRNHSIRWTRTKVGSINHRPCPGNLDEQCSRRCRLSDAGNPVWSATNCNFCYWKDFEALLKSANDLNETTLGNQTVVAEIARKLSELTKRSEPLGPDNLNTSVTTLYRLAVLRSESTNSPSEEEIESFFKATSNVLQPSNSDGWKEIEEINATFATSILFSLEVYGKSLSMLNASTKDCNFRSEANLVVEARSLEKSDLPLQSEFPNCSVWGENMISISGKALSGSILSDNQTALIIRGSFYETIHNFLPRNEQFGNISTNVITFSIDGLRPNARFQPPIQLTFRHLKETNESLTRKCVFWNSSSSDWDSEGCFVDSTNSTHTICTCDHLTSFAVLMGAEISNDTHEKVLSAMTMIGCSISVVALALTILIYALTWKHSKSTQAAVLLNLCVALIIAYVIFMTGADKVTAKDGCTAVAVLLHYFFLAAFFLMLAEAVELLLYIIFVFHVRRTRETVSLIATAWVLPLIIVAVSLGLTRLEGYGHETACWLSTKNLIWAFVGPVLCILTVNSIILIIVLGWMSKRRSFIANNDKKRHEIRATIWNLSVTCPVLGLGWLFGAFFLVGSHHIAFQYLFVIANAIQGLLIFIFHGLLHNKKVKEKISSVLSYVCSIFVCSCCRTVYDVSAKVSSTQELTRKPDKHGVVHLASYENKGMDAKEVFNSAGTQTTSFDDSGTMPTTP